MDEHLATIWESIADQLPGEIALVHGAARVTWQEFEQRAARFAAALAAAGVRAGQTVAIDMYNCTEYLEVFFAALKIRAVPANVNYRYLDEELRQLLQQSDAAALVYHAALRDRVSCAVAGLPGLRLLAEVGDATDGDADDRGPEGSRRYEDSGPEGSREAGARACCSSRYEDLISAYPPAPRIPRPASDVFVSYTGGTTGLPKGVEYVIGRCARNTRLLGRQMLGLDDIDWDGPALGRALLLHRQQRRRSPCPPRR